MQINHQTLIKGLMSVSICCVMTGCVDNKYDIKHADESSRFYVNNLTVPINLSQMKLENVIDLDNNENIKTIKDKNGKEIYALSKGGSIETSNFSFNSVKVDKLTIKPTTVTANVPSVALTPGTAITVPTITLSASNPEPYMFEMNNVDKSLVALTNIKTKKPIEVKIELSVPRQLTGNGNKITFKDLQILLPWGFIMEDRNYDKISGILNIASIEAGSDGKAIIKLFASGLETGNKGNVSNGHLEISGNVCILGGKLDMTVKNVTLPQTIDITANYNVSGFEISNISGIIKYNMDEIGIDPITLNDLPDFLDGPNTNIRIAEPSITLSVFNPLGKYGSVGKGKIKLTSVFKDGKSVNYESDEFSIEGENPKLAFCTAVKGYKTVGFNGLGDILSNGNSGLPQKIEINISDIVFTGEVSDLPLGGLGIVHGDYEFTAPLGFENGSQVIYEATEDGWSGDDLNNINIDLINIEAICSTDLPVSVELRILPLDKEGNEIPVTENSSTFSVPAMCDNQPVELHVEGINGNPIQDLDGVKFIATVKQDSNNTQPIGPELFIKLSNLKITVSGYYNVVDDTEDNDE